MRHKRNKDSGGYSAYHATSHSALVSFHPSRCDHVVTEQQPGSGPPGVYAADVHLYSA